MNVQLAIVTSGGVKSSKSYRQCRLRNADFGLLIEKQKAKGSRRYEELYLLPAAFLSSLNSYDFKLRVNLLLEHSFDSHQRARQRAWATAACALIAYVERVLFDA